MRAVIQRVSRCCVTVENQPPVRMETGLLVLIAVHLLDTRAEAEALAAKIASLRIFTDEGGKMNLSLSDIGGGLAVVPNFTLYGDCKKGRRPSYYSSARPETAVPLYEFYVAQLRATGLPVITGAFGADMQVELCNDGPVTLVLDTDDWE